MKGEVVSFQKKIKIWELWSLWLGFSLLTNFGECEFAYSCVRENSSAWSLSWRNTLKENPKICIAKTEASLSHKVDIKIQVGIFCGNYPFKRSGYFMHHQVWHSQILYYAHRIVLYMDLRRNSHNVYFPIQRKVIGFYLHNLDSLFTARNQLNP